MKFAVILSPFTVKMTDNVLNSLGKKGIAGYHYKLDFSVVMSIKGKMPIHGHTNL